MNLGVNLTWPMASIIIAVVFGLVFLGFIYQSSTATVVASLAGLIGTIAGLIAPSPIAGKSSEPK